MSETVIKGYSIQLLTKCHLSILQLINFIYLNINIHIKQISILGFNVYQIIFINLNRKFSATSQFMIQLNTARFARLNRWLQWQAKYGGIFIRFPQDRLQLHTLFFAHKNISFKHFLAGFNLGQSNVSYPQGVTSQTNIMEFLQDETTPRAVELTLQGGQKRYLRNLACDNDIQIVKRTVNNPKSIYGYLRKYLQGQTDTVSKKYTGSINYFLNHFYMRLTAQTYCKMKGINLNANLDQKIKSDILNYIGQQYQNHSPAAIKKVQTEKDYVMAKINTTQKEIKQLQKECDRKIQFYKMGAVLITAAHIISFGYMIFFVDWLGWDIIQPLTYSVGVFYTLLGIRFYRKYRTDRTGDSIRQILLRIVMKPSKLIALKDLKIRLALQESQLKRVQTRLLLLKNRINFQTSLIQSFRQSTNRTN